MKLSDLRPCDNCGQPIGCVFNVVRISPAVVNAQKANEVLGLAQMLGSHLGLAETMGASSDCVTVASDKAPELLSEFLICNECVCGKPINLGQLMEARSDK